MAATTPACNHTSAIHQLSTSITSRSLPLRIPPPSESLYARLLSRSQTHKCARYTEAHCSMDKSELDSDAAYLRAETPRGGAAVAVDAFKPLKTSSESGSSDSKKEPSLRRQMVHGGPTSFKFTHLYRFATPLDKLLLVVGVITAGANGALFPVMAIVFGNVLTGFTNIPVDMDTC
ncbi:hypothetical protein PF002_g16971 [Phytophthora fragariae]|uniref:ABC transmembrane type-1 domain-containing protein n=1 Tax=Phytophthora fragariae TaxID=53985 RepID=A0A6A3YDD0_9STRA|nr:hypothetical protein PF002_g16971 [Phytophthora fragariae]